MTTRDSDNALVLSDGFVSVAAHGTTLPTTLSALSASFADLGWLSENGFGETRETNTTTIRGINGAIIRNIKSTDDRKFTFECLESNAAVMGLDRPGSSVSTSGDANEVQTVTITGTPAGGTFTLSFGGYTTSAIAYNAAGSAVKTALEALASIGSGNVNVTGGPGPGTPYVVTFQGTLANTNVALMTADDDLLTGGTSPAVGVVETTAGAAGLTTTAVKAYTGSDLRVFVLDKEFGDDISKRICIANGEAIRTGARTDSRTNLSILQFEVTCYPESDGTLFHEISNAPGEVV